MDNGRPQKSSSCRLHIEWIPKPELPPDAAALQFEESPFVFSVMESDPVAHMVGVVATEASDVPVWFEITGTTSARPLLSRQIQKRILHVGVLPMRDQQVFKIASTCPKKKVNFLSLSRISCRFLCILLRMYVGNQLKHA